jgi:hypothetical protein
MALSIPPPTQMLTDTAAGRITEPWYRIFTGLVTDANADRRTVLTATTTYYVRTTGNDDTGDGSVNDDAHAFATPRGAYDYICENVDCAGFRVIIQMAAGTYSEVLQTIPNGSGGTVTQVIYIGAWPVGAASITFRGDTTTPTNVTWAGAGIWINNFGYFRFEGIYFNGLDGIGGSEKAVFCNASGANIVMGVNNYGTFGSSHFHIYGPNILKLFDDYTISGSANRHIWLEGGCASLDWESSTITLTGTPAFGHASGAFIMAEKDSSAFVLDIVFSGSATGKRYFITDFATIDTADVNEADLDDYFPGSVNGTIIHRAAGTRQLDVRADGGTTTASAMLQCVARDGQAGITLARYSNDAYGPHITMVKSRGTSRGSNTVPTNGDELGRISWQNEDSTGTASAAAIRAVCAGTAASNDAPTHMEFGTTPDGSGGADTTFYWRLDLNGHLYPLTDIAYDLGSSTLGIRNIYLGTSGVALGRTGTWTPTLLFNGSSADITYATQIGRYVLVGDMVTVWASIVLTSNGSSTGSAQIFNLPFDCVTLAGYEAVGTFGGYANISETARNYHCSIQSADSRIDLLKGDGADASTFLNETDIDDDAKFNICLSYLVA